jgi:hypothetical protein
LSSIPRRSVLALLAGAFLPMVARAETVRVGGRPVLIPEGWTVIEAGTRAMAASPDQSTYLVANERAMPVEGLEGVNAADFVFDRLQDVRATSDRVHEVRGERVRTLTGTGTSDGQPQRFWFRLAAGRTSLVTVLVYSQADGIQTVPQATITRILDSISA